MKVRLGLKVRFGQQVRLGLIVRLGLFSRQGIELGVNKFVKTGSHALRKVSLNVGENGQLGIELGVT